MKIFGSQNELTFPIGFGPGTYATFHRVLELGYAVLLYFKVMNSPVFFISAFCFSFYITLLLSALRSVYL